MTFQVWAIILCFPNDEKKGDRQRWIGLSWPQNMGWYAQTLMLLVLMLLVLILLVLVLLILLLLVLMG